MLPAYKRSHCQHSGLTVVVSLGRGARNHPEPPSQSGPRDSGNAVQIGLALARAIVGV